MHLHHVTWKKTEREAGRKTAIYADSRVNVLLLPSHTGHGHCTDPKKSNRNSIYILTVKQLQVLK